MSIPPKKLHTPQKSKLHFDITHPDSLVKPREYDWRMDRLDKFMRRAANPAAKAERRHKDRLALIDYLLSLTTRERVIDGMIACIKAAHTICQDKGHRLESALAILQGDEDYLDQCGGILVLPISSAVRHALAAEAGGAFKQFDRAAEILEEHFGLKSSQNPPKKSPNEKASGELSDAEIKHALSEIERLSDGDND